MLLETPPSNRVVDSGVNHYVANNLNNMHIHYEYDDTSLKVFHIGLTILPIPNTNFHLKYIICVPNAKHNLIIVSKICKSKNAYVEFHSSFFCVKDQVTGVVLMHNPSNGNLFTYRPTPSSSTTLSTTTSNFDLWHARFEHIYPKTLTQMLCSCDLSRNFNKNPHCNLLY